MSDYRDINKANRDERAPAHAASPDYNLQGFVDDPAFLSEVVRFDRPLRGGVGELPGGIIFERDEPSVWEDGGTYVQTEAVVTATMTHE